MTDAVKGRLQTELEAIMAMDVPSITTAKQPVADEIAKAVEYFVELVNMRNLQGEFGHKERGHLDVLVRAAQDIAKPSVSSAELTAPGASAVADAAPTISDPELEHAIAELNGAQTYTMRHKEIAVIRAVLIERNNLKVERETLKADLEEYKEVAARIQDVAEHYLQEARLLMEKIDAK